MSWCTNVCRVAFVGLVMVNLIVVLVNVVCGFGIDASPDVNAGAEEWHPLEVRQEIKIRDVRVNSPSRFSTRFKNISNEPVEISRVSTTCGCTDIEFEPTIVPSGATGEIRGDISAKSHAGVFHVRATGAVSGLASGKNGSVSVLITLDVSAAIEISTATLTVEPEFGAVKRDGHELVMVRNLLGQEQEVSVTHNVDLLSVEPSKFLLAPNEIRDLAVLAKASPRRCVGKLVIKTSGGESHQVGVQVRPQLPVTAVPEKLVLGVLSHTHGNGSLQSSSPPVVILKGSINASDVKVRDLPLPLTKCSVSPQDDGLALTFSMADSFSERLVRGDIVLLVSTAESEDIEIRIPVIGVVRDTKDPLR
jgi:hypothetical protein